MLVHTFKRRELNYLLYQIRNKEETSQSSQWKHLWGYDFLFPLGLAERRFCCNPHVQYCTGNDKGFHFRASHLARSSWFSAKWLATEPLSLYAYFFTSELEVSYHSASLVGPGVPNSEPWSCASSMIATKPSPQLQGRAS